jgi:hypothetical protein
MALQVLAENHDPLFPSAGFSQIGRGVVRDSFHQWGVSEKNEMK